MKNGARYFRIRMVGRRWWTDYYRDETLDTRTHSHGPFDRITGAYDDAEASGLIDAEKHAVQKD